ncbi:hypothetical protein AURDEDRAFT_164305 [Auricularia subglabra TFB-10046 SS5]|nr:hypothetical protein AURDEDRAFT_164305 [Auricularia subglabra TFB-10046 SS5]
MFTELATQPALIRGIAAALGDYDKIIPLSTVSSYRHCLWHLGPGKTQVAPAGTFSPAPKRVDLLSFQQETPSYGDVSQRPGYKEMDAFLVCAVREAEKALKEITPTQRDWLAVLCAFQLCPLLVMSPEAPIDRSDEFTITRNNWFKKQVHYRSVGDEVYRWFKRFRQDLDTELARGAVDLDAIHDIVAHAGRMFEGNCVFKKERQQRTLLDIGVYRLELVAWYQSRVILGRAQDKNGIMAQFNMRQYQPHEKSIESLRETMQQLAIDNTAKQLSNVEPR